MGRTLKRVPMDFKWPRKKVWEGYLCPIRPTHCEACDGCGYNPETKKIEDDWYDFAETGRRWCDKLTQDEVDVLVEKGRLSEFRDGKWVNVPRTAEEVNEVNKTPGMGDLHHDGLNRSICVETRAKRFGVYGLCPVCNGDGQYYDDPEDKARADAWERIEPPEGPGYQLWETTSEGSPSSPVFSTLEMLCEWCADHATTFGSFTATKEEWMKMLKDDFVVHQEGRIMFL